MLRKWQITLGDTFLPHTVYTLRVLNTSYLTRSPTDGNVSVGLNVGQEDIQGAAKKTPLQELQYLQNSVIYLYEIFSDY